MENKIKVFLATQDDYPEDRIELVQRSLLKRNYDVSWAREKYISHELLRDVDVILFLVDEDDMSFEKVEARFYNLCTCFISYKLYQIYKIGRSLNKLMVNFLGIHLTTKALIISEVAYTEENDKLVSKYYGKGAKFDEFVPGYLRIENRRKEPDVFEEKNNKRDLFLLLLRNN